MITLRNTSSPGWTRVKRSQTANMAVSLVRDQLHTRLTDSLTDWRTDTEEMSGKTKLAWHSKRSRLKRLNGWVTNCLSQSVSWSQQRKTTSDQMSQNRILKLRKSARYHEPAAKAQTAEDVCRHQRGHLLFNRTDLTVSALRHLTPVIRQYKNNLNIHFMGGIGTSFLSQNDSVTKSTQCCTTVR